MSDSTTILTHRLKSERVQTALRELPGWDFVAEDSRLELAHDFRDRGQALAFVQEVVELARKGDLSLRLCYEDRTVEVSLNTHLAGSVTPQDLTAARRLQARLSQVAPGAGKEER